MCCTALCAPPGGSPVARCAAGRAAPVRGVVPASWGDCRRACAWAKDATPVPRAWSACLRSRLSSQLVPAMSHSRWKLSRRTPGSLHHPSRPSASLVCRRTCLVGNAQPRLTIMSIERLARSSSAPVCAP